jgi:hypothetical protein
MRTIMLVTLGALLASVLAAAQTSSDLLEGTWAGEVACLHGGSDAVVISIARDASGRFAGASDWGLARSDGRKGPQVPFTRLTVNGRSVTAVGTANDRTGTLEAVVRAGTMRGTWRVDGVDDVWTFVARRSDLPPQ